jgi:hypothetical protein
LFINFTLSFARFAEDLRRCMRVCQAVERLRDYGFSQRRRIDRRECVALAIRSIGGERVVLESPQEGRRLDRE